MSLSQEELAELAERAQTITDSLAGRTKVSAQQRSLLDLSEGFLQLYVVPEPVAPPALPVDEEVVEEAVKPVDEY